MSEYEWRIVVLTVLIAVVTFIYAVFAALQWWAMQTSNDINREALVSVQRAFVTFKNFHIDRGLDLKGHILGFEIIPEFENNGVTPAIHVHSHVSGEVFETTELPKDFNFPDIWPDNIPKTLEGAIVIAPKAQDSPNPIFVSVKDMSKVVYAHARIFIWGWATYRDVFQHTPNRRTEFCIYTAYVPPNSFDPKALGAGTNVQTGSCPIHNCTDDDCKDRQ